MAGSPDAGDGRHIPVLLDEVVAVLQAEKGQLIIDGTFGAGGYTRRILETGASVMAIDRDPSAIQAGRAMEKEYAGRLTLVQGAFSTLDQVALLGAPDGVVLDIGVSSMQIDEAERGFSFQKDGPLDMRMSQDGESAADLVNSASEATLADILYLYGEERASRRIAHAIVEARAQDKITTTLRLAEIVAKCLPRPKPGQNHPATRSFQALRIAVNEEFSELAQGLAAAERALKPGGQLAVVTFHSLEDRIVKRFLQLASGAESNANRYAPATTQTDARFTLTTKAIGPDDQELAENPRARSAKLRVARRTAAPAQAIDPSRIDVPQLQHKGRR